MKISCINHRLELQFPLGVPSESSKGKVVDYIRDWFDLDRDLAGFFEMACKDVVLQSVTTRYYGLRMIGIPDLFEALTWAIMGQQINLKFAYMLKKRFVEQFGERVAYDGKSYWLYPELETVAQLKVEQLRELQFTTRKAAYVIGAAEAMVSGELSKTQLMAMEYDEQHQSLLSLKGVGAWTADYVMMKCLLNPAAFPIADVGLHNALKVQLDQDVKPTLDEIKEIAKNWSGWEAYATFYLWRSLYE